MAIPLNRTTITSALTAADSLVGFASSVNIRRGDLAYIDREAIKLLLEHPSAPNQWFVIRGQCGTAAAPHAINNQVYTGHPGAFYMTHPQGMSSAVAEMFLPHIHVLTGDMYVLSKGGSWQKIGDMGVPLQPAWASGVVAEYTTSGAIAVQPGAVQITGAAVKTMTLANPVQGDDGLVMTIYGAGGGQHTVTTPLGFNGAGGSFDVATFAAAGGTLVIQVIDLAWRVLSATGVTFA